MLSWQNKCRKSLLFNKLIQYKNSIVLNKHGVTKDINQGKILYKDKYINIFDTAGITSSDEQFSKLAYEKTLYAINEHHRSICNVYGRWHLIIDQEICSILRKMNKNIILVINKADKQKSELKKHEFSELGLTICHEVSAKTNHGLEDLVEKIFHICKASANQHEEIKKIAFIGKPNVGKSTLINNILNEAGL